MPPPTGGHILSVPLAVERVYRAAMKRNEWVVAAFLGCCCGIVACSQSSGGGGTGGSGGTSAGGSAGGGTGGASSGGSGGATGQGGNGGATGGASGGAGAGGTNAGGSQAGGSGGATPPGTGGGPSGGSGGASTTAGASGGAATGGAGQGGRATGGAQTGGGGSTGTGGRTGTGGAAGTGTGGAATGGSTGTGGATSIPVVPTTVSGTGRHRFAFGDVVFEVDPKVGGRVGKLALAGADMVVSSGTATDQTDWGAVFWTSPQSAWAEFWPAPAEIDRNAYTGGISNNHVVLDSAANASLGVSVKKDFSADAGSGWITVVYTIKASKALQAAPWENSRVPRGGLAFFPAGASLAKGPLTMTESGGMVWFDDKAKTATSASGEKAIADSSGGFLAYALDGNLFLRKFTDTPANAQAPKEGEAEIYPGTGFLELEVQGPYTSIPAGGTLAWTVAWRIVKIPASVTVSAGSSSLADFAKQQAAM